MSSIPRNFEIEDELLERAMIRLRSRALSVVCGLLGGTLLFLATSWLVIRGGETVGPHLGLLGVYLPGYSVTWGGAFLGLFYGLMIGAAAGWVLAAIYNWIADSRSMSR